ncbi:hypothetical protein AAG906_025866 [Vitis piasezkii]
MLQLFPLTNILIDPHSSRRFSAFDFTIQSRGYGSHYQGVFRVKFNQDKFNVEDVMKFGSAFHFGLGRKSQALRSIMASKMPTTLCLLGYEETCFESCDHSGQEEELNQVFTTMHTIIFYA